MNEEAIADKRLISKDKMMRRIRKFYEQQKYRADRKTICCAECGKVIKDTADPQKIEYVKTASGTELYFHTRCIQKGRNFRR